MIQKYKTKLRIDARTMNTVGGNLQVYHEEYEMWPAFFFPAPSALIPQFYPEIGYKYLHL
jgi:hypothetical protein